MSGVGGDSSWTPRGSGRSSLAGSQPAARGPRWIISLRALVVVLAMLAAAVGVLWIESASVQGASAGLGAQELGKVTVPPVRGAAGSLQASSSAQGGAAAATSAAVPGSTTAAPSAGLLVHVAGAVKNPGVYILPVGSRAFQAVEAAGGALPAAELSALNLAAQLSDGTQLLVPTKGQPVLPAAPASGAGPPVQKVGPLINLNTASAADLDALPGVGPVLAQRIVAWRIDHGPFVSVDALDAVSGIGATLLAGLRDLVTV
ncbi:helix-hairpin-helix domain-containing protein [Arthrobacter sp. HLT1-20]